MTDALAQYKAKRNFSLTSEPAATHADRADGAPLAFVIQKHWASHLHYDLRLELDGTLKSWAVPKGPSYDSHDKRMAVQVEDHPLAYASFEGRIAAHQYGAGEVIIWDRGRWTPLGDPRAGLATGNLKFELHGHKMQGKWALIRMKGKDEHKPVWLLMKEKDEFVRPAAAYSVVDALPDSVASLPVAAAATDAAQAASAPPAGAVESSLPAHCKPQLATLVEQAPANGADWVFEIKFDGYRMLARVEGGSIKLITRNGNDWTDRMPALRAELARMQLPDGWYDGEIVVHDAHGKPDFGLLQAAFDGSGSARLLYVLFDVPYLHGHDLRACTLVQRRAALHNVLDHLPSAVVRFSEEFGNDPQALLAAACRLGLEGVIGKRRDGPYVQRRSADWIKLKCGKRQQFVIGGYTDPHGARVGLGALLLGTYDADGVLQYAGNVGSGFSRALLTQLKDKLAAWATADSPFPAGAVAGRQPHWVKPILVCEVSFAEWTSGGAVRHAVFHGLREAKPATALVREKAQPVENGVSNKASKKVNRKVSSKVPTTATTLPAGLVISHAERVIDAQSGATKGELLDYYAQVGKLMMAQLRQRPVALVRAPAGVGGALFFQKHADVARLPGVRQLPQELDPDHPPMLEIAEAGGLLAAAQWNVVEFHSQNALAVHYDTPDRMVFDLDPGAGVAWPTMQEAGQLIKAFLEQLGLTAFVKTSGGKGLHVVVPLRPHAGWDDIKHFSRQIVQHMAQTLPQRFALKSGPDNRVGKIFIDYLRNGRGATTAAAWSLRTRPGLGVSVPIGWDELAQVRAGDQWNIRNVQARLVTGNAPWADYGRSACTVKRLTAAMAQLGLKAARQ
ncbi:DNA ligase D [Massilia sp. PWRC2]|uniref:DNA ligase D n=1 Tax=Massilia sp. PWRC2 TaxID=2804626 RepID=UPI003CF2DB27